MKVNACNVEKEATREAEPLMMVKPSIAKEPVLSWWRRLFSFVKVNQQAIRETLENTFWK